MLGLWDENTYGKRLTVLTLLLFMLLIAATFSSAVKVSGWLFLFAFVVGLWSLRMGWERAAFRPLWFLLLLTESLGLGVFLGFGIATLFGAWVKFGIFAALLHSSHPFFYPGVLVLANLTLFVLSVVVTVGYCRQLSGFSANQGSKKQTVAASERIQNTKRDQQLLTPTVSHARVPVVVPRADNVRQVRVHVADIYAVVSSDVRLSNYRVGFSIDALELKACYAIEVAQLKKVIFSPDSSLLVEGSPGFQCDVVIPAPVVYRPVQQLLNRLQEETCDGIIFDAAQKFLSALCQSLQPRKARTSSWMPSFLRNTGSAEPAEATVLNLATLIREKRTGLLPDGSGSDKAFALAQDREAQFVLEAMIGRVIRHIIVPAVMKHVQQQVPPPPRRPAGINTSLR